jgi:hypothetical protein
MKKYIKIIFAVSVLSLVLIACEKDYPVDEDGLLITQRAECSVSSFEIVGY